MRLKAPRRQTIAEYAISEEEHASPTRADRSNHLHIFLKATGPWDLRGVNGARFFDLRALISRRVLRAHIRALGSTAGDRLRVIQYTMKDWDAVVKLEGPLPQFDGAAARAPAAWAVAMRDSDSTAAAMVTLAAEFPAEFFRHGPTIEKMLGKHHRAPPPEIPYTVADFTAAPVDWATGGVKIFSGPSNLGKTEFALANFDNPLVVSQIEDLRDLIQGEHDGIVFDDMNFATFDAEATIALVDFRLRRSLSARYSNVVIPAGMRRIFTTNKPCTWPGNHIFKDPGNKEQRVAIQRRFEVLHFTEKLYAEPVPEAPAPDPPALPPAQRQRLI
jgi:hypothetical protein